MPPNNSASTLDDAERALKLEQMQMDINLKRKQVAWETPKNIAILAAAMAAIIGTVAGVLGFKLGQQSPPPQPIVIQLQSPVVPK